MRTGHRHRGRTRLLGLALASVLVVSGCSDDGTKEASSDATSSSGSGASTASSSESVKPYLPVPDGVELTTQGSKLDVGQSAVVAYHPRQDQVGVLDIKVTRLEKTTFKESFTGWKLDEETRSANPYFVRATIKNVGETNLGGRPVPLYVVDGTNKLNESWTFASTFKPCPSTPFPDKFKPGDKTKTCLVYLLPDKGQLTAVSFRPSQDFNPITWTGELQRYEPAKPKKGKKNNKG